MKFLLVPFAIVLLSLSMFSQVTITPMKVIYVRQGEDIPDHKKRFEVTYPIVSGVKKGRVKRQFENTLSYWEAFDTTLEENLDDYYWLEILDYETIYNKNGILVIRLMIEGSGAYPDGHIKTLVVDTTNGRRVTIPLAFTDLPGLAEKLAKMQEAEVANDVKEWSEQDPEDGETISEYMKDQTITVSTLDEYSVSDEGVKFHFDYGFPHAVQALQPVGDYSISWEEISPFLKKNGILSRLRP
ncbi:MAG TPA: hypothetical protein VMM38_10000 [Aridibacter sp.]|nr:hypothetical protein [Aridibacter sp.]